MKTPYSLLLALLLLLLAALPFPAHAQEEEEPDPLGGVIADMQVAGGRLSKKLTDKPTQQKQQDAIDKLDSLIKLLEQRRQQGQGNMVNNNPENPADESTIRQGPGGSGPLHAANRNGRNWGQLPERKRQEILQSMTEGFPPHYQKMLERYFYRLAEEKPAGEAADAARGDGSAPRPEMQRAPAGAGGAQ